MEEKTKKWSRNTKLVPQEYLDSDDENIAKMQDEIEETMAQMNPLSILSKLEPKKPHKDMESSVKVEVEEVGQNVKEELKHTEDLQDLDLNIKIHSVKSFRESTQDAPNMSDDVYDVFNIDEDELREDFESLSQETTSVADKIIEIYLKNTFGKKHLFIAQSRLDQKLQKKLRTWRSWYKSKPQLRDAPLMYICYACNQGWWHFSEFREHLSHCRKWICLNIDMTNYQAMLIATKGRRPKGPKLPTFDSNCWKCNKDGLIHLKSQYVCDGCNTAFPTCTALCFHEGECKMYRKKIFVINGMNVENNLVISYHCLICSYKDWDKDGLIIHIKNVHSVRSDLPIDWTTKVCGRCNLHYHEFTGYHCSLPTSMESCVSCTANFQTLLGLKMHVNNSVDDYKCKLCNKILQKSCMEPEHMLEHTNNYMQLFKCPFCPEPMYFLYEKFAKHHKNSVHQDHLNRMPLWLYGYKVIIPKRLFERLQPIKNKPAQPPAIFDGSNDLDRKNDHHAHIDKYSQDLRDAQEQPDLETPRAPETRNLIYAENGVEITIINKSVLQELSDAVVAEIKAKEIITEQCKIVTNPEMNIKLPDNETYVNKKISKTDNLADKTEVEVGDIEGKKEIESDNIIKVKEELMETDELDVNIKVKNEVDDGVTNFVDIEVKSESIEEVRTIESYEVKIKQESEDFRDYEPDIISSGDMNSADGTEDAEEDTCHKRRKKANVPYIPKAIFTDKYECTKCNKAWPTFKKYLLHFSVHNYKSRTCPQCLKYCRGSRIKHVFAHVNSLFVMKNSIEHLKVPRAQSNYRCKKCKEVLGVKEFFRHWESHLDINDNTVSEPQCPVDMTEKPHLNEMIELLQGHDSSETWKLWHCQVCNKKFQRQNDCKRHYIEHLLADAYQEKRKGVLMCQICGAGFQKTDLYRRHMRDHASLPVYICEICDKTFSDSSNFSKHKKVHNLAVLICDICQKKFKNKSFLIKHIEMHQLVKPINCKKCEKVFYTQSSYRKHLKGNRFTCVICNIVYYSIKEKLDHMWQVHKERKYEADCPLCDKSFRKFQDVKQHLRREHSEDKVRLEQAERAISLKFGTSK